MCLDLIYVCFIYQFTYRQLYCHFSFLLFFTSKEVDLISPCSLFEVCAPLLCAFDKLRKVTHIFVISVCPAVCLRGKYRLSLDGFSWNAIFEDFSKICWGYSSFIKIWQEYRVLYTKTCVHLWYYLFLELEIFHTKALVKITTCFMFNPFFRKSYRLWGNVEK
jgi:hypothetical protein